ncbi:hypothetical protein [Cerasicoccus frondis]|uniref:hypothetical protein n=1 Tax=Cerasicoccus frondis TaxID=490090 RepID=UPI0028529228|nr:hypothetical protein [Cerasicoccus frondis]
MSPKLINKKQVRAYALGTIKRTRPHLSRSRVSSEFLEFIEAKVRAEIDKAVAAQPSRGKTLINPYQTLR